jgi:hypothetical protein
MMDARRRHERCEARHEVERLEHDVRRAIPVRGASSNRVAPARRRWLR